MSVQEDGPIQCVQETVRQLLADCWMWQNWQGQQRSREQALARIYHDAAPPPKNRDESRALKELMQLRPFALISTETFDGYRLDLDSVFDFEPSGRLHICIEQNVPNQYYENPSGADIEAKRNAGRLIMSNDMNKPGLVELTRDGAFRISRVVFSGPMREEEEETKTLGPTQFLQLDISWRN